MSELTQAGAERAVQAGVGENVTAAAGMYLALATALPAVPETDTLAAYGSMEITTAGYSRQAVTWTAPAGDPSEIENTAAIEFGPFTADPPEVGYVFLCTASIGTSGDVLAQWTLDTARDAGDGDKLYFGAGDITISVD